MNTEDYQWIVDTLRREENNLREMARQAKDAKDDERAAECTRMSRELFGVRQLLEEGRGSQDHRGARPRKARAVRIKVTMNVVATLGDHPYELINISVTGALGNLGAEPKIGRQQPFRLGVGPDSLDLMAHVVRVQRSSEPGRWRTAIAFDDVTSAKEREIATHVGRLMVGPAPA
jgi:hypothetical protein